MKSMLLDYRLSCIGKCIVLFSAVVNNWITYVSMVLMVEELRDVSWNGLKMGEVLGIYILHSMWYTVPTRH